MKTKLQTQLPVYRPSEKVWQNIEKELDNLYSSNNTKHAYMWSLAACFLLMFFIVLSTTNKNTKYSKAEENTKISYTEETLDSVLVETTKIPVSTVDAEIENLCEWQPIKCKDEYAQSLLKQIKDLSNASSELDYSTAEQSIPDATIQKQKIHLEKEKHKRIKKLKQYLNN